MAINNVTLMGNLTANPELKTTQNGTAVARFTLAVQRDFKENGEYQSDFINCMAWRNTAEFISRYFAKGDTMAIVGRVQTGSFTDKDGNKRYTTEIVADKASFAGGKKDSTKQNNTQAPTQRQPQVTQSQTDFTDFEEMEEIEGDLPF